MRTDRALGAVAWAAICLALLVAVLAPTTPVDAPLVLAGTAVFFLALLARLVVGTIRRGRQRAALATMTLALLLWAGGSVTLSAADSPTLEFPAPGEWLFIASYVAFAAFLLLDARSAAPSPTVWLEATVVTGGTACLAGLALLLPSTTQLTDIGVPLLVAILYPSIDVLLALVVVAQIALRQRSLDARSLMLLGGFGLLAVADLTFVTNLSTGTYGFTLMLDIAWASALALLVAGACRPRPPVTASPSDRFGALALLSAAAVAVAVLALPRPHGLSWYLTLPAVVTLVAAGGRLLLALRQARTAAEAYRLSRTDDLTGLPNRRALLTEVDNPRRADLPLALLLLDLDGFKDVNDTFGHATGDDVLRLIALRLRDAVAPGVLVVRLGGDEFAVLLAEDDVLALLDQAERIRQALRQPLPVEGVEIVLGATVGIAVRARDDAGGDLLRHADIAMYQARQEDAGALVYDPARDQFSRQRLRDVEELRHAIADDQLEVWYQPQVDASTQRVLAVEALVRWNHPRDGLRSPATFLPTARRVGLMPAITAVVVARTVGDAMRWRAMGMTWRISVNVAPPELLAGSVITTLLDSVASAGLPASTMVVEVTEESFLSKPERARQQLRRLQDEGIDVAVDDYGTGFSSLSYLRDLNAAELKIDRSFVASMLADERSSMIVRSTTQMAHALGMRVVAEGVEDPQTAAELVAIGVDALQGYHLAPPMPAGVLEAWARDWSALVPDETRSYER